MTDPGLSPAQLAAPKLAQLASDIRLHHAQLELATANCIGATRTIMESVLKLGNALLAAKKLVEHGLWEDWIKSHSGIPFASAQRYMRVAANLARVPLIEDLTSLRGALALIAERNEGKEKTTWPAYLHGIARAAKLLNFVQNHPLAEWPDEGRNQLREDLLPVAKELWPANFA